MKHLIACIVGLFSLTTGYGQHKPNTKPPPIKASKPPQLTPPAQTTIDLKTDPFREHITTFWSDTLYSKTDTSFQVIQWVFEPSGSGKARLSKDVYSYPAQYTKDSIEKKGERYVALAKVTHLQDGSYIFDQKAPQKSTKLIFTDQKTKKHTVFKIIWESIDGNRAIIGLRDEKTNTDLLPGSPQAYSPVGF